MKVYTVFYKGNDARYGYESSQVSRQRVFDKLGIPHTVLLGLPLPYPDWRKRLEDIGYTQYISICNRYCDSADDTLNVTFEAYQQGKNIVIVEQAEYFVKVLESSVMKTIYFTQNNVISHIEDDTFIVFYTSGPYLKKDKNTAQLWWYNKDGSLALRGEPSIKADYLFYDAANQLIGNSDTLMKQFLVDHLALQDAVIFDPLFTIAGDLKRYLMMKKIKSYQVIHYNVLADNFSHIIPSLKPWLTYIAASEKMVEPLQRLGLDVAFVPPMHIEEVANKKQYQTITNYCLVGSYSYIKRIDMAVQAFAELAKRNSPVHLTIYGGDEADILTFKKQHVIPNNVRFVPRVDTVPYEQHEAYISCSQSECFANAMVEASGKGLAIVASNVDLAHRYYATLSQSVTLFDTVDDLISCIHTLSQVGGTSATEIAEQYALENTSEHYKQLFLKERGSR